MSNEGKHVSVHYVGTLDDGTQFDSSRDRNQPLEFTCMAGQMIPGFDRAVRDMEVGQTVTIRLEPKDAYGESDPSMIQSIPKAQMPGSEGLTAGQKVMLTAPTGQMFQAKVTRVTPQTVTFDLNHELAGQHLTFEIELLSAE